MKKNLVLFALFIVPIVAYLFFASGVNGYTTLPILTKQVPEFGNWKSLDGKPVKLTNKITVLGFAGNEILKNRGNYFNLNQKIYQRYHEFTGLQFVVLCPEGTEADAAKVLGSLKAFTETSEWRFVFAPQTEIDQFYSGLRLKGKLDALHGTDNVYLIDKKRNLRGRKDKKEYMEGYSTFHPSELSNEMLDDFKVLLYEYRRAYKSNNPKIKMKKVEE